MTQPIRLSRAAATLLALAFAFVAPREQAGAQETPVSIQAFDTLSPAHGWLLLDQRLYRTENGGRAWAEITLPEDGSYAVAAMEWVDADRGWLARLNADAEGGPVYALARTSDGGATWATLSLDLFQRGEPAAYAQAVSLHFTGANTGWLAVTQATGPNFSLGTLFKTEDGGATWVRMTLPRGGSVQFESATEGWLMGGVTGDERYRTADGGETWRAASPGEAPRTPTSHWALDSEGQCTPASNATRICTATTRLRRSDGGVIALPIGDAVVAAQTVSATETPTSASVTSSGPARWLPYAGHGFDSCTLPNLDQMQDWHTNSPYRVWNLYIGGSSRAPCGTLTAGHIAALAVQGWRFIPTWVGPQAACTGYPSRMSGDPATAYQQGLVEADLAVNRAAELGLTYSNDSGTVLYYDLEAYPNDAACRAAAQAFMNGWAQRVRERGNLAGVYGTPCTSYLSDFVANPYVPDAVWIAAWYLDSFDANATVWLGQSAACLSNSLWVNQQRLRQYAGGHNETWGATTINIDSNVLDGPVASLRDVTPLGQAAEFYRDFDFVDGSACSLNTPGWFNAEECGAGWNDQLSSLRLRLGWSARVFRDTNLAGPSYCYVLSDPDFANDRFDATTLVENNASSVKVYDNAGCVDFFTYLPFIANSGVP
jgi:photosystem II stability/assembly factor-like uncharacterized protein